MKFYDKRIKANQKLLNLFRNLTKINSSRSSFVLIIAHT